MMPKGNNAAASTYSFSSQPKAVTATRKKYRDPGETNIEMYRDLKETCIAWDKRVHRGNTYSMYTQNAIREALQDSVPPDSAAIAAAAAATRKRVPKEKSVFDMPLPEKDRIPVDLTMHLVAKEREVISEAVEAQTDEFLPEPPPDQFQPQKTGVDACTQVEDGELFDFNYEVDPILDVLVNKTLEQSIMEVEEESEMEAMREFKDEWYQRQDTMMKDWQLQVDEEWVRWRKKEQVMREKREEKRREARVLLKIQAMTAAKAHLSKLVPNAVNDLQEVAFPDMKGMAINRIFLTQLLGGVHTEVHSQIQAERCVGELLASSAREQLTKQSAAIEAQRQKHREQEKRRYEQLQIRRGKIRIFVDDAHGGRVVGPIQISSQHSLGEVNHRIWEWLQENEPALSSEYPHGVSLCVAGEAISDAAQVFESKAGELSIVPQATPPPTVADSPPPDGDGDGDDDDE